MNRETFSDRYSRQVLFPPIGAKGQARIRSARVAVLGCGALGATLAEQLTRAGVGRLRLIDRDIVEESNLGRQALYTSEDAVDGLPKAVALERHLRAFNPEVGFEARVGDVNAGTIDELLDGVDLILDGSDNFDVRYLLNDFAVDRATPWIYGACVGSRGMTAVIIPNETPCLRCLFSEPPPPGSAETCDTSGIIAPAATLIASLQVAEALKILVGDLTHLRRTLLSVELWPFRWFELGGDAPTPVADCRACGAKDLTFLRGDGRPATFVYCGRNAVQVVPGGSRKAMDLDALALRLAPRFPCRRNGYVLRVELPEHALTVFDDGRALVSGTGDPLKARSLYDRYVGG